MRFELWPLRRFSFDMIRLLCGTRLVKLPISDGAASQPAPQGKNDDGYIFTCVACGHKVCLTHDVEWHEGETCQDYTDRVSGAKERDEKAQEEASIAAINKLSEKCPGLACACNIQENQGCDHMTCSRRRYEFYWECLADYQQIRSQGNTAHEKTCKYHTSSIV